MSFGGAAARSSCMQCGFESLVKSKTRGLCALLALLLAGATAPLTAQQLTFGAGVNAGTIPRALPPLCDAARRLSGGGVSATANASMSRVRINATVDYLSNGGTVSVAGCIPLPPGISVDSSYGDTGTSAVAFTGGAWLRIAAPLDAGVEAGWVHDRQSWFIAPAIATHFWILRVEALARLHTISFEEITRESTSTTVREISRQDKSEHAWGFTARALVLTGRRRNDN